TGDDLSVQTTPHFGGARFSVSSIYVPQGSVRNAMAVVEFGSRPYGRSNFCPEASSFLQNSSRFFTSNPMWSRPRPRVPAGAASAFLKYMDRPGSFAMSTCGVAPARTPGSAPNVFAYQSRVSTGATVLKS